MASVLKKTIIFLLSVSMLLVLGGCSQAGGGSEIDGDFAFYDLGNGEYGVAVAESARDRVQTLALPSTYQEKPVTSIIEAGFANCTNLKKVTIPTGITKISSFAFSNCNALEEISISDTVAEIGNYAFSGCKSLETVMIPNSVKSMGTHAFSFCKELTQIAILEGLQTIEAYTFYDCTALESIVIPDSVKKIGQSAFENCLSLSEVEIGSGVSELDSLAFYACTSLRRIDVKENNKSYASYSGILYDKPVRNILLIPAKLSGTVIIPEGVNEIPASSFAGFDGIQEVKIPYSMQTIGACSFLDCDALERVVFVDPYGWKTESVSLSSAELSTPETAAKLLTEDQVYIKWKKDK